jgi:endonuclease YncB( thermonuclease family)
MVAPSKDDKVLREYIKGEHGRTAMAKDLYSKTTFAKMTNAHAASSQINVLKESKPNLNINLAMNGLLSLMESTEKAGSTDLPKTVAFSAVRVKDGDTFFGRMGGSTIEVRPYGLDAAETSQREGPAITKALAKALAGGKVTSTLYKDPKSGEFLTDDSGRYLADVYVNGVPLAVLMEGKAFTFIPGADQPIYKHPRFIKAESKKE